MAVQEIIREMNLDRPGPDLPIGEKIEPNTQPKVEGAISP